MSNHRAIGVWGLLQAAQSVLCVFMAADGGITLSILSAEASALHPSPLALHLPAAACPRLMMLRVICTCSFNEFPEVSAGGGERDSFVSLLALLLIAVKACRVRD